MLPLAKPGLWLAGAAAIILGIVLGSLMPGPLAAPVGGFDKLGHVGAYLLLTLWLAGIIERRHYFWAALAVLLIGMGLELVQAAFTASRQAEWADVAANGIGIGTALVLALTGAGGWACHAEAWLGWRVR